MYTHIYYSCIISTRLQIFIKRLVNCIVFIRSHKYIHNRTCKRSCKLRYVRIPVNKYVHVYINKHVLVHVNVYVNVLVHVNVHLHVNVHVHVNIHVHVKSYKFFTSISYLLSYFLSVYYIIGLFHSYYECCWLSIKKKCIRLLLKLSIANVDFKTVHFTNCKV